MEITVIVPCYNEEATLPLFLPELQKIANEMSGKEGVSFEFLFINDGSKDCTLELLRKYSKEDERVKYISFSRNFGKEAGIYAGLQNALGDYVVIMDADLQHPPALLVDMYDALKNKGYDCAGTRRVNRKGEPRLRSFFAGQFYKLINRMTKTEIVNGAQDYQMMTRPVVNAILQMKEYNRFSKGIFSWVGFSKKWIECENTERVGGTTQWSFWSLLAYALEGIIAFTTTPLVIASLLGILCCIGAVILALVFAIKTIIWGEPVAGFPTLVCLMLFIGGAQLLCIGILGQYLAKTYLETKQRPIYIVDESSLDIEITG